MPTRCVLCGHLIQHAYGQKGFLPRSKRYGWDFNISRNRTKWVTGKGWKISKCFALSIDVEFPYELEALQIGKREVILKRNPTLVITELNDHLLIGLLYFIKLWGNSAIRRNESVTAKVAIIGLVIIVTAVCKIPTFAIRAFLT